ncbi:ABC transporter substrate-binding protein [Rhizobium cremeum]|uniref:ABC transporter substrate-binding protein n=1 Tax=Rhizobium cremeum TaxID=2813827 RepID=UPI0039E0392D
MFRENPGSLFPLRRRTLLRAMVGALSMSAVPVLANNTPRIASLDYGLASTLLSLGVTPAAVASLADWDIWMVEPEMPPGVLDLGSPWEVNFEVLVALKPDLILATPYLDALIPKLEKIAPVLRLAIYTPEGGEILPASIAATRKLAEAIGRAEEGERYLAAAEAFFADCRRRLEPLSPPPLALINFMDARHARIYGAPGLFNDVLEKIGVENAWKERSNYWGFQAIGIEELSRIEDPRAQLIAFEPVPADVMPKLSQSPLWQALPFARPGHFSVVPAALMFGMVNEAMRLASLITSKLESGS